MTRANTLLLPVLTALGAVGCNPFEKCDPSAPPPGNLVTVPLTLQPLGDNGILAYGVRLSIGCGPEQLFLLDTGSTALRVKKTWLAESVYDLTDDATEVTFVDGTTWRGHVGEANVSVGGVFTANKVRFHVIDKGDCDAAGRACPEEYKGQVFAGLVGASLRAPIEDGMYAPFLQLMEPFNTRFALAPPTLPGEDGALLLGAGITVGMDPAGVLLGRENTPFTQPNGVPTWDDVGANVCVGINRNTNVCRPGVFDSGTTAIIAAGLTLPRTDDVGRLSPGSIFSLGVANRPDWRWDLTIGNPIQPSVDEVFSDSVLGGGLWFHIVGMPFFLQHTVLYDAREGRVTFWRGH